MVEKIPRWYKQGLWTAKMVQDAVNKKIITQEKCDEIISAKK